MGTLNPPPPGTPRGRLVLMPNALDLGTGSEVGLHALLPSAVIERAASLPHWVAENAKTARAFLKRVDAIVPLARPLQQIDITELPRPPKGAGRPAAAPDMAPLLAPARNGHDIGLISEAGMPAVADPGAALVLAAHEQGIVVEPLVGPSALLLALAASGLNGQQFAFVGYLPVDSPARAARIRELETLSRRQQQTQLAIETPYRNDALLAALIEHLQPTTRLAVASGLTLPAARCRTMSVAQWRKTGPGDALGDRLPAVFAWLGA
ncbi:SAM-dependent methyltransferase [Aquabacterium sp. OR-4]|uniref:SAM-dependent methyltransferase n=1 Tax=Aquabacterium sp. OR-4 TaxID=2978127 RepID=UPI0021B2B20B|nr:SAM-dependent methyltransferase [Aquabacterium sp. OR-4]MDT7834508.1 SAM-dependent methyltransferase [Aquabacterium sp. OR-4]